MKLETVILLGIGLIALARVKSSGALGYHPAVLSDKFGRCPPPVNRFSRYLKNLRTGACKLAIQTPNGNWVWADSAGQCPEEPPNFAYQIGSWRKNRNEQCFWFPELFHSGGGGGD